MTHKSEVQIMLYKGVMWFSFSYWLVLGLAINVVDPFYYHNAKRLRMHIFLRNCRQIELPVVDAHGIQITRLYLKYNALYYIATT